MTTTLNCSTRRRLLNLNQMPYVWEGDRRPLSTQTQEPNSKANSECILWVDGSQGIVRAMDVVASETGPEATVRTLLRAMEHPNSPAKPARPQKIVVRDREIQFYLRGVLQELEIAIEYVPELPLIDELYRGFQEVADTHTPDLPPQYAEPLTQKAFEIWQAAPWGFIEEHQILSVELNSCDVGTLYASVMGMLGMEYGILLYRSEESLKQFRASVLTDEESTEHLEEAFLKQDCLFLTFERTDEADDDEEIVDLADLRLSEIQPSFGNIHPLEGLRSVLYEEEAIAVFIALEALKRFIHDHRRQLTNEFSTLSRRYRLTVPQPVQGTQPIAVTVSTMPSLAAQLEEMSGFEAEEDEMLDAMPVLRSLRDDLIPEDSFLSLGVVSWEMVEYLRTSVTHQQAGEVTVAGDGLPVILIQTSRPKAKTVIEAIQVAGGLKGICFNPGADPFEGERYDLGILQTKNGEMFLFGEFLDDDPVHAAARKKWNGRCKHTKGYCGLIVARGLMGATRGNPQSRDMMALFEARSLSPKELGIGTLKLMPQFD